MVHCFYVSSIGAKNVELDEQESAHCVRVLRLREGDAVLLTDGKGTLAHGIIETVDSKGCVTLGVVQQMHLPRRRGQQTILAVAPTKNADRMEWLVEKTTEVGCGAIVPLQCERSVRAKLNNERIRRVAVAALKQSQGTYLPIIYPMMGYVDFVNQLPSIVASLRLDNKSDASYLHVVAHCADGERHELKELLLAEPERPLSILIGPEGDFSAEEVDLAIEKGMQPVSLGSSRLRTETAALVAAVLAAQ